MAPHSSVLAWRIPWTEDCASPLGCKKSDTTEWLTHIHTTQTGWRCFPLFGLRRKRKLVSRENSRSMYEDSCRGKDGKEGLVATLDPFILRPSYLPAVACCYLFLKGPNYYRDEEEVFLTCISSIQLKVGAFLCWENNPSPSCLLCFFSRNGCFTWGVTILMPWWPCRQTCPHW